MSDNQTCQHCPTCTCPADEAQQARRQAQYEAAGARARERLARMERERPAPVEAVSGAPCG